jgi:O-antigen/teichoic acid export membrane protein
MLLGAMDQALLPVTSRIYGRSGISSFKDSCRYALRYLFLFYFPLGFALAASAPSLITIILGERFNESAYPVVILIMAITLTSPIVVVGNLLRSADKNGIILKSATITLVVQAIISIITIPAAGVLGVAAARFISRFLYLVLPASTLNKMGGFDMDKTALRNGLGASILISTIILGINSIVSGPFSLLLQYIVAFLSLLIFFRITHALNKKDIELVDKIMSGKMRWLIDLVSKIVLC